MKTGQQENGNMAERYDIRVKVISQEGYCAQGHKVGDQWVIRKETPKGICLSAYNSMYPHIRTLMFGGTFPWGDDSDSIKVACPDPDNPLVFEVRRIRK